MGDNKAKNPDFHFSLKMRPTFLKVGHGWWTLLDLNQ